eukprot:1529267-Pleurochrysis_carterae.AAC.3
MAWGDGALTTLLVLEACPAKAKGALRRGASAAAERAEERARDAGGRALPLLFMPMAELFSAWAVSKAVATETGTPPLAIIAGGDCDPAALAINAASSGEAAMRELLARSRRLTTQWMAVSVPREANVDADRLSHPRMLAEVEADAAAAGWRARRARIRAHCWTALWAAMHAGVEEAAKRETRR